MGSEPYFELQDKRTIGEEWFGIPEIALRLVHQGSVVHLEYMLEQYYQAHGWNAKIAIPIREKLLELDLVDMANDIDHYRHDEASQKAIDAYKCTLGNDGMERLKEELRANERHRVTARRRRKLLPQESLALVRCFGKVFALARETLDSWREVIDRQPEKSR